MEVIPNKAPQNAYILQPRNKQVSASAKNKKPHLHCGLSEQIRVIFEKCAEAVVTHFSKHPLLVETVDEEDGRLCEGHEEVTEGQIHYEVVWQAPQLLITR